MYAVRKIKQEARWISTGGLQVQTKLGSHTVMYVDLMRYVEVKGKDFKKIKVRVEDTYFHDEIGMPFTLVRTGVIEKVDHDSYTATVDGDIYKGTLTDIRMGVKYATQFSR